jgi:site-specific DNA recombinase
MNNLNLRIAAYVRVSTEEQANAIEGSIDNQKYRLKSFLDLKNSQHKNWGEIINFYVDDGYSAKDTKRPAYQKMMNDIKRKKVDLILITDLSRLSRNIFDFCGLMDDLEKNEAQFLSIKEQFDSTTPAGKMMIYNMINLAQFEREQVSERVALGVHSRAMRGLLNGAKAILGFDKIKGNTGSYVINEFEAEQVKTIFKLFINLGSCGRTIKELNQLGIFPKSGEEAISSSNNQKWNREVLIYLLKNKAYIGQLEVNKKRKDRDQLKLKPHQQYRVVPASWPAIVSEDDFNKVQQLLMDAQKKERARLSKADYRFFIATGLLRCADCGQNLVGQTFHGAVSEHKYYGHTHKNSKYGCKIQRINADELEKQVLEYVWSSIEDAGYLNRIEVKLKQLDNVKSFGEAKRKKVIQDQARALQNKIDGLLLMQSEITDKSVLKVTAKSFETLVSQKAILDRQLEELTNQTDDIDFVKTNIDYTKNCLEDIKRGFSKSVGATQKRLLKNLISEITVFDNGIQISLNLAYGFEAKSNIVEFQTINDHSEPLKMVSGEASNLSVFSLSNGKTGDSGSIRTNDPLLRREMLYPTELRNHFDFLKSDLGIN